MNKGYQYETKISVVPIINVSLVIGLTLMLIAPFLSETDKQVKEFKVISRDPYSVLLVSCLSSDSSLLLIFSLK